MSQVNVEDLVGAFLNIRTAREKLLREFETADSQLKKDQSALEVALLNVCNDVNANSINTTYGTVMRKLTERAFCSDWESFHKFVIEHQKVELLEKRIHQTNFRQFVTEEYSDGLPPGINLMREYGITVRKSSGN